MLVLLHVAARSADAGDGALLTHCVQQFQLGRFAPELDAYSLAWVSGYGGTLGLPVHGKVLHPAILPWRNPPNLTDDKPWDQRTRVLYGVRYGLSVWSQPSWPRCSTSTPSTRTCSCCQWHLDTQTSRRVGVCSRCTRG